MARLDLNSPARPETEPGAECWTSSPGRRDLTSAYLSVYDKLKAAVIRRVASVETAEDIVQDAWLRLASRSAGPEIEAPDAFVFRVAGNLALDHHAHNRRRGPEAPSDQLLHVAAPEPGAERLLMDREALNRVLGAVNTLPPRCREVFVLRKLEGVDQREIARRLGISRNMVEKHLRRALEILSEARDGPA